MELKGILISLLLVGIVVSAITGLWGTLIVNYDVEDYENISWLEENAIERAEAVKKKLGVKLNESSVVGTTSSESSFQVIPAIFDTLKIMFFDFPSMMLGLVSDMFGVLNIEWNPIGIIITSIIAVFITFAIINAVLKWKV